MSLIVADRVQETTNTTGTGAYILGGASPGFQAFSVVTSNADTVYYSVTDNVDFEVGLGTYASSGNLISRTTVFSSSNSNNAVSWGVGTKNIFLTYPADKAVIEDVSNNVTIGNNLVVGGTVDGVDIQTLNTTANAALPKAGGTMTGDLVLNADPTAALQSATKQYVDTIAAAGIHYHQACRAETTANLNATYSNGSSGVGATLTNAGTQAALVLDGVTLVATDRVMVQDQTNTAHNGVYTVTTVGSGSTNWVLTRATDADSYSPSDPDALGEGDAFFITEGTVHGGELDVMTTSGVITFGTTGIVFAQVSDAPIYTAGAGLSISGTEFSLVTPVTSATALATARTIGMTGDVVWTSATFDGTGNVTGVATIQPNSVTLGTDTTGSYVGAGATSGTGLSGSLSGEGGTFTVTSNATNANTASTIVARDGSGNFSAGTITGALSGNATTATSLASGRTIGMTGDVVWTSASFDGSGNVTGTATIQANSVALGTDTTGNYVSSIANGSYLTGGGSASENKAYTLGVDATSANTASKVVARDSSSNFSAGTVTAALTGNASTATALQNARTINGVSFNGTANITVADSTKLPLAGGTLNGGVTIDSGNGDQLLLDNAGERYTQISFKHNGAQEAAIWYDATDNFLVAHASSGDGFKVQTGGSNDRLTIDASGNVATNGTTFKSDSNTDRNFKLQASATGTSVGLSHFYGNGSHGYQLYASGTSYGFLDGNWAQWDIQKVKNGQFKVDEGAGLQHVFNDGYHPNADKWTTARTLTLSGDATGSVSWDGSANASLAVAVTDADTVDGIHAASFLRSDADDSFSGGLVSTSRDEGIFGTYDSTKTDQIWSMGTAYKNNASGANFGNLYGLAYKHTNNTTGGTMAGGHQVVWCTNGGPRVALGESGIWSSGQLEINSTVDQKIILGGSSSPYIRFRESSTDKAYIQWNTDGYLMFRNQESGNFRFRSAGTTNAVKFTLEASDGDLYGSIYSTHDNEIGFLDDQNEWAYRFKRDDRHEWRVNNSPKLTLTSSALTLDAGTSSTLDVICDNDGLALIRARGTSQGTGAVEVGQSDTYGGGMYYNGDGSPPFASGEVADTIGFYRMEAGSRTEVFYYPYNSNNVVFNGNVTASDMYISGNLVHNGDSNTYLGFGTDTISLVTGNSAEVIITPTGVRLGDSGNGYFQPVTGNYGSIQIDGGNHGGWEGYSIGGRIVFMHDNSSSTGIYNDVDNEWLFNAQRNSYTQLYYNGAWRVQTSTGGVSISGDLNSTSDIRYKKNIETIDSALDKVQSLRGVTFDWDNDAFAEDENTKKPNFTERATGVIAQDVEKVLPEAVRENEDGFKNVAYGNMVGLLIEAIKEQQAQIDELKAQLNG